MLGREIFVEIKVLHRQGKSINNKITRTVAVKRDHYNDAGSVFLFREFDFS